MDVFSTEMDLLVERARGEADMGVLVQALAVGPHGRHFCSLLAQHLVSRAGWDGMGWDGMGWDGMGCLCHADLAAAV